MQYKEARQGCKHTSTEGNTSLFHHLLLHRLLHLGCAHRHQVRSVHPSLPQQVLWNRLHQSTQADNVTSEAEHLLTAFTELIGHFTAVAELLGVQVPQVPIVLLQPRPVCLHLWEMCTRSILLRLMRGIVKPPYTVRDHTHCRRPLTLPLHAKLECASQRTWAI